MTLHAPETPDVEALAYNTLKDLGGITVFAYDAQTPWPHVADTVAVQVDVRASTKKRAHDRAYTARQRLLRLPFDSTGTPVAQVEVIGGPAYLPEEDGAPRYVIRTAITVRAIRSIA
jgi:hypothetical protein